MKRFISVLFGWSLIVNAAQAQDIAVTGAKIHTMGEQGTLENATLLVKNGKIHEIVEGTSVPSGYHHIDGSGKVITPGLIGAMTNLGLVEVSLSAGTVDARVEPIDISTVGAAYDVQYAINKDSTLIPITRVEGFTSAVTGLSDTHQLFSGQGAVISLSDDYSDTIKTQAFLHTNVSNSGVDHIGESRAAIWVALLRSLNEVATADEDDLAPTGDWNGHATKEDVLALKPVLTGDVPLLITAHRASDIMQVIQLKRKMPSLNIVLVGVSEGWRVADEIATAGIPVIVNPEQNLPGAFDQLGASLKNSGMLSNAGVKVAIGMDTHNIRLSSQQAGNAVANGMSYDQGLASLTSNVADIFGVDNTVGRLVPGLRADFVIWSGDPLEVTQAAEQVFISGEAVEMTSRQIQLRDRYLHRNGSKPVSYQ